MVVSIAADPWAKNLCIFDSEKQKYETKVCNIIVREWEINKIEEYFENITQLISKPIEDFYLILNWEYYNEILKKFFEVSQKFKIKRFKIISEFHACGIGALKYISGIYTYLLIFDCYRTQIMCTMWKLENNAKSKISVFKFFCQTRTSRDSTIEDIKKLFNKINPVQDRLTAIVVFYFDEYDSVDILQHAFNGIPSKIFFENAANGLFNILTTIQRRTKNEILFDILPMLNRSIEIKFDDYFIESLKLDCALPFQNQYNLMPNEYSTRLKVYEDGTLTQSINVPARNTSTILLKRKSERVISFKPLRTSLPLKNTTFKIPTKLSKYNKNLNAVGIDLGSAECCAYVFRHHGPDGVVLDPVTNQRTLPSYVAIDELNNPCGQNVINRMETKPQFSAFDVKRLMGKELNEIIRDPLWPYDIINYCEQIYCLFDKENIPGIKSTVHISACLLKHIKKMIDEYQGTFSKEAVVTVPSAFTAKQKDATIDAANIAGWHTVTLLPEPIAALIAYSYETEIPNGTTVLAFDCGDGTTDICIAKIFNSNIEILIDNGNSLIAGREFDKILINYFGNVLKDVYANDVFSSNKKFRIMRKCREIKHILTIEEETYFRFENLHKSLISEMRVVDFRLHVDDFVFDSNDILPITRSEFERMSTQLIHHGQMIIDETLAKANLKRDNIDIVFQVGGGCRMPMIKQMLAQIFQNSKHHCSIHPEELVAKGAALYAYEMKTVKR